MYLVRAPCKKTDWSVGMSLDKYEYIIISAVQLGSAHRLAQLQSIVVCKLTSLVLMTE